MNILKKITAGTLALVLATGIAGSAIAQDASNVTSVQVTTMKEGGVTSATIGNLEFGAFEYALEDRPVSGSFDITASDQRGLATGWNVTLTGTDFNSDFGINNLSLTPGTVTKTSVSTNHRTSANPVASPVTPVQHGEKHTVLAAADQTGAGVYNAPYAASLNIPAGTLVGNYQTTLVVTITGNEPGAPDSSNGDN